MTHDLIEILAAADPLRGSVPTAAESARMDGELRRLLAPRRRPLQRPRWPSRGGTSSPRRTVSRRRAPAGRRTPTAHRASAPPTRAGRSPAAPPRPASPGRGVAHCAGSRCPRSPRGHGRRARLARPGTAPAPSRSGDGRDRPGRARRQGRRRAGRDRQATPTRSRSPTSRTCARSQARPRARSWSCCRTRTSSGSAPTARRSCAGRSPEDQPTFPTPEDKADYEASDNRQPGWSSAPVPGRRT